MTIKSILRYAWGTIFLGIALMIPNLQAHSGEVGVTDTTIKIALMVPLTGPAGATVGPGMSAGARTVWTEINEKCGIQGRNIE